MSSFLLLAGLIMFFSRPAQAAQPFELHLLDVGQGQSTLIGADGCWMLLDGGGREASSFVVRYLQEQGIEQLDYAAVSHYEEDHMSGVIGALYAFPCKALLLPSYSGDSQLYNSLSVAAVSNGCVIMHPQAGNTFSLGSALVEVVGPVRTDYADGNDLSLAFRFTYGDIRFLICGDAMQQSEQDMVESGEDLRADVYVVDHHGSSTSSMDFFLDAVSPSYAMISCKKDNGYGHPSMETLQRLQNHGVQLYRTDLQGTVIACSDGSSLWFTAQADESRQAGSSSGLTRAMPGDSTDLTGEEEDNKDNLPGSIPELNLISDSRNGEIGEEAEESLDSFTYVCNTNTKKFHWPDCRSVDQIKEKNRLDTNLSREELIEEGYEPCGNCHP